MKNSAAQRGDAPPRVTVVVGDDSIGREKAKGEIVSAVYATHDEVAEERYDSSVERFEEFTARIMTPSLFQSVRIFHIRHANQLSAAELVELGRVVRFDIPDAYLVVEFDENVTKKPSLKKSLDALDIKSLVKKQPRRVVLLEFAKPPDWQIPKWLTQQVPNLFGRKISKNDAEYLVECVGSELDTVYSELQKLDIHLPPKAPIDRAAIESISGATRVPSPFELGRALGARDFPLALDIIDSLFAASFYAPPCLAVLFRHFWGLFRIRAYARTHPDTIKRYLSGAGGYGAQTEIAHEIGIAAGLLSPSDSVKKAYPVIILSQVVQQARSFTDEHLREIFRMLCSFDVGVKTGRVDAGRKAFEMLCYRIVRIGEYGSSE